MLTNTIRRKLQRKRVPLATKIEWQKSVDSEINLFDIEDI